MLIWNVPATNQKKQRCESQRQYGLAKYLEDLVQQALQRQKFNW